MIKKEHNVKAKGYLLAGILGYGVVSTAFAGLAIVLVLRRESGRAQARPRDAAVAGDLPRRGDRLDVIVYAIEAVALILLGRLVFRRPAAAPVALALLAMLLGTLRSRRWASP